MSLNRLAASLNQKFSKIQQVDAVALASIGDEIIDESLKQVPYDTGALASIAGVSPVKVGATIISVKAGYGLDGKDAYNEKRKAYASSYMVEEHENLSYMHENGRKAKYLEDPINAIRPRVKSILAAATKTAL